MLFKKSFRSTKDIQKHCIDQVVLEDGLFLEFGVYKGTSINFISSLIPDKKIYGFDSFEGLPEEWVPSRPKGYFSTDGKLPEVNKNTTLVKGFFDKSIPEFKKMRIINNAIQLHFFMLIATSTVQLKPYSMN